MQRQIQDWTNHKMFRTIIRQLEKWTDTNSMVCPLILLLFPKESIKYNFYSKYLIKKPILGWHTATLVLLGLALITSFASVCLGACGCCYASVSLVFTAATLITSIQFLLQTYQYSQICTFKFVFNYLAFLSSIAEGLFFFFSHRADNRFIKGIVGTYEVKPKNY